MSLRCACILCVLGVGVLCMYSVRTGCCCAVHVFCGCWMLLCYVHVVRTEVHSALTVYVWFRYEGHFGHVVRCSDASCCFHLAFPVCHVFLSFLIVLYYVCLCTKYSILFVSPYWPLVGVLIFWLVFLLFFSVLVCFE